MTVTMPATVSGTVPATLFRPRTPTPTQPKDVATADAEAHADQEELSLKTHIEWLFEAFALRGLDGLDSLALFHLAPEATPQEACLLPNLLGPSRS